MATDAGGRAAVDRRRQARNRAIRLALTTTVAARLSGVLLQVVSLPIAAMQLGAAGFSIYAMLGALLSAMTLANFGIGQATTLHMARAMAAGRPGAGRALFLASLGLAGGIAACVAALAALVVLASPLIPAVFARQLGDGAPPIGAALFVCLVFLATQALSVFEAAQLARQRQHRLNIALGAGTLVAALAVWVVAGTRPTVLGLLVAVHLPVIAARAINAWGVWFDLAPRAGDLAAARAPMRGLLADGLRFVSGTTIANFLCHPFSVLAVGLAAAPPVSAAHAALMSAVILASSVTSLIVTPFRGALPEAIASGDRPWLRHAVPRLYGAGIAYGLAVCLLFGAFGPWLFAVWYGGAVEPGRAELVGAGLYFLVLSIEVTNFTWLSSAGRLRAASRLLLIKAFFSAASVYYATVTGNFSLVFWVLLANNVLLSLMPLSVMAVRAGRLGTGHAV